MLPSLDKITNAVGIVLVLPDSLYRKSTDYAWMLLRDPEAKVRLARQTCGWASGRAFGDMSSGRP